MPVIEVGVWEEIRVYWKYVYVFNHKTGDFYETWVRT